MSIAHHQAREQARQHADWLKGFTRTYQPAMAWRGVHVYPDRLIRLPEMAGAPSMLDEMGTPAEARSIVGVTARLEESGAIAARATLARSLVPGMHGWQKKIDTRVAHVVITGPDFEWWVAYDPKTRFLGRLPQQLVAAINQASRAATPPAPQQVQASAPAPDRIEQLRGLADLRDRGVLSDAEFEQQKARILS